MTLLLVSQAPLAKLQAYRERMGWSLPWVSAANTDVNFAFGASSTVEQVRGWAAPIVDSLPPIVRSNADATGTDTFGYLTEAPMLTAFTLSDGCVYQTYATTARGVEFLMGYYPVLDRAPKGRDRAKRGRRGFVAMTSTSEASGLASAAPGTGTPGATRPG